MIPPMVPGAKERADEVDIVIIIGPFTHSIPLEMDEQIDRSYIVEAIEQAYRDGFAAALVQLREPSEEWNSTAHGDSKLANGLTVLACPSDCPHRFGDDAGPGSCELCYDTVCDILAAAADAMGAKDRRC